MSDLPLYIIIPTHNRKERLALLLDSIAVANIPEQLIQIIIIENGSQVAAQLVKDNTHNLPVTYMFQAEGNKSRALNMAIRDLPKNALLLFFDDDIKISSNNISAFIDAAAKFGPRHYFGGCVRSEYEVKPATYLTPYLPLSAKEFFSTTKSQHEKKDTFETFLGANWACFLADLDAIGGFSPIFGPGAPNNARGQESNAQWLLYQNGCTPVGVAGTSVDHWVPKKFVQPNWVIDRVFNSSIHHGKNRATTRLTLVFLAKTLFFGLSLMFKKNHFVSRAKLANALGYLKGMIS